MSRSNPTLECLECGKDLGDLMARAAGLDQFCLCPECMASIMGHIHAPLTEDELEQLGQWVPQVRA
jgi:hypothetical protein